MNGGAADSRGGQAPGGSAHGWARPGGRGSHRLAPRARPRARALGAGLLAAAALSWVGSSSSVAAQEAEAPLMVQTVPALQGVELQLFDRPVLSDEHGLAVATGTPGTYSLTVPASGEDENIRWRFSRWSDGVRTATRTVTVSSFTFLEAGYDVSVRTTLMPVASGSEVQGAVDEVTLVDGLGERLTVPTAEPVWVPAQRVVETASGLAAESLRYRVEGLGGEGYRPSPTATELVPTPAETLEVEVTEAVPGFPPPPAVRDESASSGPTERAGRTEAWPWWSLTVAGLALIGMAFYARYGASGRGEHPAWAHVARGMSPAGQRGEQGGWRVSVGALGAKAASKARAGGRGAAVAGTRAATVARTVSGTVAGAAAAVGTRTRSHVQSGARRTRVGLERVPRAMSRAGDAALWWSKRMVTSLNTGATRTRLLVGSRARVARARAARADLRRAGPTLGRIQDVMLLWSSRVAASVVGRGKQAVSLPLNGARGAGAGVARAAAGISRWRRKDDNEQGRDVRARAGDRERVEVVMADGRVIEGWWDRRNPGTSESFFSLTLVTRVVGPDGAEIASTPADSFIPVAKIEDIRPADEPLAAGEKSREDRGDRRDRLTPASG